MILNIILKNTFKVPLNPVLNIKGYAFPSGHMIAAVAFYGWFFTNIRHPLLRTVIVIILTGLGFTLIYNGYHYLIDIIGAIIFGIIVIAFTYSLTKEQIIKKYPFLLGIFLWLLTVPIIIYLNIIKVHGLDWLWIAFLGLLGFSISWGLFNKYLDLPQSKLNLFLNLTIIIALVALIKYGDYLFKQYFGYQFYLSWFLIGFSFPLSVRICHFCKGKNIIGYVKEN